MKRNTRKVTKRTFTLQNALPRFVSIVSRGANLTPLSELRFSDDADKFSEVEINRIVFTKDKFSREQVEAYLNENDYAEFSIEETEETFEVPGVDADKFEDVAQIEYGDGVMFYVGKLAVETDGNQATTQVVDAEILDYQEPEAEVVQEGAPSEGVEVAEQEVETNTETEPEKVVQSDEEDEDESDEDESDEDEEQEEGAEPIQASDPETNVETGVEVFNAKLFKQKAEEALAVFMEAMEQAKTESFSLPVEEVELFTAEQVAEQVQKAVEEALAQHNEQEIEETIENTIDETTIVVQNRHSVESEEIQDTVSRNPENDEFSKRKSSDLFGLR